MPIRFHDPFADRAEKLDPRINPYVALLSDAMKDGSLPIIVAFLVSLTTPTYLLPLIQTPIGNVMLGVAAIMMFLGGFIMNRMIQFDI